VQTLDLEKELGVESSPQGELLDHAAYSVAAFVGWMCGCDGQQRSIGGVVAGVSQTSWSL